MLLTIIRLIATVGLPLFFLYGYHRFELHINYRFTRTDWVVALSVGIIQLLASQLPYHFFSYVPANFLHHAIGGGVAVAIMVMYILRKLWPKLNIWKQGLILLAVVNVLGNANEIAELIGQIFFKGDFISSLYDTSTDLLANNVGALCAFLVITVVFALRARGKR